MDPITAVGAVASIIQLAQGALTLSITLYGLGAAILSASEDLKNLADDLKAFSQSLTLLSRLLEDSKSWYSDDIYLLTAKVIQDCADLYVKIDVVLSKINRSGKVSWMKKIKYVMKESHIRKLLGRLRDLKGTLATILMSLQVDLQLSLLNITSSSKLQRAPDVPLQPHTVQTLRQAQEVVRNSKLLSVQVIKSDGLQHVHVHEKEAMRLMDAMKNPVTPETISHSELMFFNNINVGLDNFTSKPFVIATDAQASDFEIVREVEGVLHSFRIAIEVLEKVMHRIDEEDKSLRNEVDRLQYSLTKGLDIHQVYSSHYRRHGVAYLKALIDSRTTLRQLEDSRAKLMVEIVTKLHMYSAAFEELSSTEFQELYSHSEKSRIRTFFELDRLALLLFPRPLKLVLVSENLDDHSEFSQLEKQVDEIHVSESDVDSRLSAAYDFLLRNIQPRVLRIGDGAGRSPALSREQGFLAALPSPEAAQIAQLYSARLEGDDIDSLNWDSRASTIALPKLNSVTLPKLGDTAPMQPSALKSPTLSDTTLPALSSLTLPTLGRVGPIETNDVISPRFGDDALSNFDGIDSQPLTDTRPIPLGLPSLNPLTAPISVIPSRQPQISSTGHQYMSTDTHGMTGNFEHPVADVTIAMADNPRLKGENSMDDTVMKRSNSVSEICVDAFLRGDSRIINRKVYRKGSTEVTPKQKSVRSNVKHVPGRNQNFRSGTFPRSNRSVDDVQGEQRPIHAGRKDRAHLLKPVVPLSIGSDSDTDGLSGTRASVEPNESLVFEKAHPGRLWQLAYLELKSTQSDIFKRLNSILSSSLDFNLSYKPGSEKVLPNFLLMCLGTLSPDQDSIQGLEDASKTVKSIIKVVQAVSRSLSLENSALAWSGVISLLKAYKPVISLSSTTTTNATSNSIKLNEHNLQSLNKTIAHLSDIVSMIARYAVMENLYENQTMAMVLQTDYKAALVQLCCKMLEWFVTAFAVVRDGWIDDKNKLSIQNMNELAADALWTDIIKMDEACKRFAVAVVVEDNEGETEDYDEDDEDDEDDDDKFDESDGEEEVQDEDAEIQNNAKNKDNREEGVSESADVKKHDTTEDRKR